LGILILKFSRLEFVSTKQLAELHVAYRQTHTNSVYNIVPMGGAGTCMPTTPINNNMKFVNWCLTDGRYLCLLRSTVQAQTVSACSLYSHHYPPIVCLCVHCYLPTQNVLRCIVICTQLMVIVKRGHKAEAEIEGKHHHCYYCIP